MLGGERDAVPEALNLIDDQRPEQRRAALALLDELEARSVFPGAHRLGVTGTPGAGKSTLIDALLRALRARGETLAVLAVDPSSRASGGALLGDRVRMRSASEDPGIFVRSMAAREQLGGTASGAHASVLILACVFDRVIVETVGVGQSESDVRSLVDTLLLVVNPGSGDALQFMKAGLLEWPDVFAVNKSDLGAEAARTRSELESGLGVGDSGSGDWQRAVLQVSARDGSGLDALQQSVDGHREYLRSSETLATRRETGRVALVLGALRERFGSRGVEALGGTEGVASRLLDAGIGTFSLAAQLDAELDAALATRS